MFEKMDSFPHDSSFETPELERLIIAAHIGATAKLEQAITRWHLGSSDRWSADFGLGTISFHFGERSITGLVEVIGSYSHAGGSWLWAWANAHLPEGVTGASRRVHDYGVANGIEALIQPKLDITDPEFADDLGAVGIEVAGLSGMYRSPKPNGDFVTLGFTDFTED